ALADEWWPLTDAVQPWEALIVWPFVFILIAFLYAQLIGTARAWNFLLLAAPAALIVGWLEPARTLLALLAYSLWLALISLLILPGRRRFLGDRRRSESVTNH